MISDKLLSDSKVILIKHEGYKSRAYIDTVGKITAGVGRNLSDRDIDDQTIDRWLEEDIIFFYGQLSFNFSWFEKLNEPRKLALIDMCFMGFKKFIGFKKMISAIEQDDFESAAKEMLDSLWAKQVGNRAIELSNIIRTGVIDNVA